MPKSRFNAVREKARASRHNPVQGRSKDGHAKEQQQEFALRPKSNGTTHGDKAEVLPVLTSLPAEEGAAKTAADNNVLWALTSLAGFLTVKAQRAELLQPKHDLVHRISHHLTTERPIEVRDAASGCLRNLCVEAGNRARKLLEQKDCINACIAEVKATARDLKLLEGGETSSTSMMSNGNSKTSGSASTAVVNKPKEEMNRKERRQAAKAEAAAAKRTTGSTTAPTAKEAMAVDEAPAQLNRSLSDEQTLACYSHLNNLVAILWCLTEVSSAAMEACERAAPILCSILANAAEEGVKALAALSKLQTTDAPSSTTVIDIGKRDKRQMYKAAVELALTSLNALVTMSESNAHMCAALAGFSQQELSAALKGKGRSFVVDDDQALDTIGRRSGRRSLGALQTAVAYARDSDGSLGSRQASTLGMLALAALHNTQSALPQAMRSSVRMKSSAGDDVTLAAYEMEQGLPSCLHSLEKTPTMPLAGGEQDSDDINSLRHLTLEILAEYAGDRSGWYVAEKRKKADEGDIEADIVSDDEMDRDSEDGVSEDGDSAAGSDMEVFDSSAGNNHGQRFATNRISQFLSPELLNVLSKTSYEASDQIVAALQQDGAESNTASSRRGTCVRALSVLSNTLLALASFSKPPPSQPVSSPTQEAQIAAFHHWLAGNQVATQMSQLWRWSFELASRMAALPQIAQQDQPDATSAGVGAECRRIMENCLGIMWSISRCYEGHPSGPQVLVIEPASFASDAYCTSAQSGAGVVESLIAAYRGSKQTNDAQEGAVTGEDSDPTTWATSDGIRVHCLGTLATLVRQSHVWPTKLAPIATLLCAVVEAVPASQAKQGSVAPAKLASLELSDATSIDGMIVAINGIIDTFADETQAWDEAYAQTKLQGKLKRASQDVRSAARTVDKRKQASLRAAADDAWNNLIGFVQYRDSLGR